MLDLIKIDNINILYENIYRINNKCAQNIMYRLFEIYEEECSFNEGSLHFSDLVNIYFNFMKLFNDYKGGVNNE